MTVGTILVIIVGICVSGLLCSIDPVRYVDVETEYGIVRGTKESIVLKSGGSHGSSDCKRKKLVTINTFLGIPFAKPPLGDLRFERPQKASRWDGVFYADQFGNACLQNDPMFTSNISEDCLNLNIYTPKRIVGRSFPVMVYFYGGSYIVGGNIIYPGHFLASKDVVVVVPNYRLGIFGFLSTPDGGVKGNMGLWDQLLALEFVKYNIAQFGGSPDKVTIFGQSAGGASVGLHMISPQSRGYFHRAICESGTDISTFATNYAGKHPEEYVYQAAQQLNCTRSSEVAMIACLKNADPMQLLDAESITGTPNYVRSGFAPIVDGAGGFLPNDTLTLRKELRNNSVPLMSGINKDDGSSIVASVIPGILSNPAVFNSVNFPRFLRILITTEGGWQFGNATQKQREDVIQALSFYYSPWSNLSDPLMNVQSFIQMFTDITFGAAWDLQVKYNSRNKDTYAYVFAYPTPIIIYPSWFGASHSYEIPYVFCYPCLNWNPNAKNVLRFTDSWGLENVTCKDYHISDYMMTLWTNFAKFGDPTPGIGVKEPFSGSGTLSKWNRFNADGATGTFYIDVNRVHSVDGYNQRNYALFTDYLPYLLQRPLNAVLI